MDNAVYCDIPKSIYTHCEYDFPVGIHEINYSSWLP